MSLKDLDDRFLPAAAARVGALADRLAVQACWFAARRRSVQSVRLADLDARFAGSGPFALMRDVPQVGFVLIAAVFLAGAGTAVTRESAKNKRAEQNVIASSPQSNAPDGFLAGTSLGPAVGDTTTHYLATSLKGLEEAATGTPDGMRTALVSFADYRTPKQAEAMLAGVTIQRVFLRAKAGGKEAAQLPVDVKGPFLAAMKTAYAQTVRGRLAAQKSYLGYVNSLQVTTKEDQAFKDLYAAFAKSSGLEARAYQSNCACVYAAVVQAKASVLLGLRVRPAVRGVQVAAKGLTVAQLQVLPLLPEIVGVVPKQQAGVESQP